MATDLEHQVLQRLPNGKRVTLPGLAQPVSGKPVRLGVSLESIGDPYIVRYRVEAARVLHDGAVAGSDYVPNAGTMVWHRHGRPGVSALP